MKASNGKFGLPKILYVQCDNGSEFKNNVWATALEWLTKLGIFVKVKLSFLPVGHTHEDIDACFGRLAQRFRTPGLIVKNMSDCVREAKIATSVTHDSFFYIQVSFFFLHPPSYPFFAGDLQLGRVFLPAPLPLHCCRYQALACCHVCHETQG